MNRSCNRRKRSRLSFDLRSRHVKTLSPKAATDITIEITVIVNEHLFAGAFLIIVPLAEFMGSGRLLR